MAIVCPSCKADPPPGATVDVPCPACGTKLIASEPTLDHGFPVAEHLQLVDLDQRTPGAEAASVGPLPAAFGPPIAAERPVAIDPARFRPTPEAGPQLELDPSYVADRAAREAGAVASPPRSRGFRVGVVVVLVALMAAGIAYVVITRRAPQAASSGDGSSADRPGNAVQLRVIAADGATISIDGRRAGSTSVTVMVPRGKRAISITVTLGGVASTHLVVPDHDQTLDLSSR